MNSLNRALDLLIAAVPRWLWAVGTALCACVIIWAGQRPASTLKGMSVLPPGHDKVLHAVAYAGLTACAFRFFYPLRAKVKPEVPVAWLGVLLVPALVGGLDEFLQGWAQRGRSADWRDWVADMTGATLTLCWGLWLREKARKGGGRARLRGK